MELMVNGQPQELPERLTVAGLLERLSVQPERVVVEVNLEILKRAEHAARVLQAGDRVEIVQFIGGGT
ncbi:MAG: sulfur carrier protein ThiS [Candidatus Omnitrophica bacterium]|nr:sulfur carrier protein ThiS [Candidatus Omnitrophota bacterium]